MRRHLTNFFRLNYPRSIIGFFFVRDLSARRFVEGGRASKCDGKVERVFRVVRRRFSSRKYPGYEMEKCIEFLSRIA